MKAVNYEEDDENNKKDDWRRFSVEVLCKDSPCSVGGTSPSTRLFKWLRQRNTGEHCVSSDFNSNIS